MATPPPASPLSADEEISLDEIDALEGKEKFKALQRRISSSTSMYSPAAGTTRSPADSPPAPPPKRTHVDDEKIASLNAKKLTHATKDRPRRKVRLPSREKLHTESPQQMDPPLRPPLPNNTEDEDASGLIPPLPPPPVTNPDSHSEAPPSATTDTSSTPVMETENTSPQAATNSPSASPNAAKRRTQSSLAASTKRSPTVASSSEDGAIVIGSFKDRLKKVRDGRASRSSANKVSDLLQKSPNPAEAKAQAPSPPPPTSFGKKSPDKTRSFSGFQRSPPVKPKGHKLSKAGVNKGFSGHTNQSAPAEFSAPDAAVLQMAAPVFADTGMPESKNQLSDSPPSVSVVTDEVKGVSADQNSSDDDMPPPPPPMAPPPSTIDFPSLHDETEGDMEIEPSVKMEKFPSVGYHSSREKKEMWKQKTVDLEGAMSDPLPLFIQSKGMSNQNGNLKDSSESISSLPDFPPPTVPATPPPDNDEMEAVPVELPPVQRSPKQRKTGEVPVDSKPRHGNSISPKTTPPTLPKPRVPETVPPTLPEYLPLDSLPLSLPDSLPPSLPTSTPPTLRPATMRPQLPRESPIPSFSNDQSPSSAEKPVKTSTPSYHTKIPVRTPPTKPSPISSRTPPSISSPIGNQLGKVPTPPSTRSSLNNIEQPGTVSLPVVLDDLKSTSEPNVECSPSREALGIPLRRKKPFQHLVLQRQSLPLSMETVKVISHGSPPASPDLKFTRIAKKTWKAPSKVFDDLSCSVSTGNMLDEVDTHAPSSNLTAVSLRSLRSSDSISFDGGNFAPRNLKFSTVSPLAAANMSTSTPSGAVLSTGMARNATAHGWSPAADSKHKTNEGESSSNKNDLRITGLLKRGQLDVVRRGADKERKSPFNSFILDSNLLDTETEKWGPEEVCQWLDLVGLGSFKQVFKEKEMNGYMLLHMDISLFAELGIDSNEIREIFLAKIYELSNPSSSVGKMEDDFLLSVDTYNSDDWRKLKAAVNVLKNPVLDDSVLLEASAIGQFLHTDYVHSQSTPSIANLTEEELGVVRGRNFGPFHHNHQPVGHRNGGTPRRHSRRASEGYIHAHRVQVSDQSESHYASNLGDNRINNWVAGLPEYGRRCRSHTDPMRPLVVGEGRMGLISPSKAKTLPKDATQIARYHHHKGEDIDAMKDMVQSQDSSVSTSPVPISPVHHNASKMASFRSSASGVSDTRASSSPITPVTPNSKVVKIFMTKVQKGSLYKSFVASPLTTVDDITVQALKKANLSDQDQSSYCIVEAPTAANGKSHSLDPTDNMVELINRQTHPNKFRFELRRKRKQPPPSAAATQVSEEAERADIVEREKNISMVSHMHSLEDRNRELRREMDSLQLQVLKQEELREKLASLQKSHSSLSEKYQEERGANKRMIKQLQDRLDKVQLDKRKTEEQLLLSGAASFESGMSKETKSLLDGIQAKYSEEVSQLVSENRIKDKTLQDMRARRIALEEDVNLFQGRIKNLEKDSRLLNERNKQVHSLDRDLAVKEDMIHKLLSDKEEAELLASQAITLQQSLQSLELNSKQQQELSQRTMRELKEHLDRVMLENMQKDQLIQAMKKERDRLHRENQAKNALNTSLEADLESYEALQNTSLSDSSRIQTLQRSISVHEVAIASLKGEFERQNSELLSSEDEVAKLRKALDKKDEQLSLLTSIDDSVANSQKRSSLYSAIAHQPLHSLIAAQISGPSPEGAEGMGIKVATFPGEVMGCVIVQLEEHLDSTELLAGDRILEVNGLNMTTKSPREVGETLQHHYLEPGGLKIVVARLLNPTVMEGEDSSGVIERYKKLNSSLSVRLDSQNAEVEHWRQECNRLKSEILKYSTSQKDKDTEMKYLKSTIQDLKQQLEGAEKCAKQLKDTLGELEGGVTGVREQSYQQQVDMMGGVMKQKDKEMSRMRAAEKARIAELKKLKREKEKAVKTVRQYAVNMEDLKSILPHHRLQLDNMVNYTRAQMMSSVHALEEDLAHHKAYLDQLLAVVIDQHPNLLTMIGEAQKTRSKLDDDDDNWC